MQDALIHVHERDLSLKNTLFNQWQSCCGPDRILATFASDNRRAGSCLWKPAEGVKMMLTNPDKYKTALAYAAQCSASVICAKT